MYQRNRPPKKLICIEFKESLSISSNVNQIHSHTALGQHSPVKGGRGDRYRPLGTTDLRENQRKPL